MALCILTAAWKQSSLNGAMTNGGFIDGLLAVVVDHGLRAESKEEAITVSHRVSRMGKLKCCNCKSAYFLSVINGSLMKAIYRNQM